MRSLTLKRHGVLILILGVVVPSDARGLASQFQSQLARPEARPGVHPAGPANSAFGSGNPFRLPAGTVAASGGWFRFERNGLWFSLPGAWPEDWDDDEEVFIEEAAAGCFLRRCRPGGGRLSLRVQPHG
ncbi:MAG: hypothetical protein IPL96_02555 [Holophagaceae bacterium]|nr:hypothetical protein [Holophagaceae bacterium]